MYVNLNRPTRIVVLCMTPGLMDNSHVRLQFDLGKENKIYHQSSKEHLKISTTAKFGWQLLENTENIASRSLQIL